MSALIGIDLGGTKTEVAVLAGDGAVLFRQRQATPKDDYTAILNTIQALVDEAIAHTGIARPQAIGCGIPGCLDPDTHTVRGVPAPWCSMVSPFKLIWNNDCNAMCLSKTTLTV